MPVGDPPPTALPESVFDVLNAFDYDSGTRTFASGATRYYMFLEKDTNTTCCSRWNYGTSSDGTTNPRAEIPSQTADVIIGGSYDTQTKRVHYNSVYYVFRLERESGGAYVAKAVVA